MAFVCKLSSEGICIHTNCPHYNEHGRMYIEGRNGELVEGQYCSRKKYWCYIVGRFTKCNLVKTDEKNYLERLGISTSGRGRGGGRPW
jgi:hypothetical protein